MDTSDSEYFESADEEIYPDDNITETLPKSNKIVNETKKELMNLNIVNSSETTQENNSTSIVDNVLNANDSTANSNVNLLNATSHKNEHLGVQQKSLVKKELLENISSDIDNNINFDKINSLSSEKNLDISDETTNKIDRLVIKTELEDRVHKKEDIEATSLKESDIYLKKSNRTLEEEPVKIRNIDVVKKKNTEQKKELYDDENLWENDDWESVNYEKDLNTKENVKTSQDNNDTQQNKLAEEENMWENDDWEPFENVTEPPKTTHPAESTWSSWGSWGGVSSILTTATQGVSTLTNQVSQGLSTVLETGMGIPDPKELARLDREQESAIEDNEEELNNKTNLGFGFSNLVSGVSHITKFVENTGSKVISGGLDTLETIGKKTMEVLQEGDPGLKNKRALLNLEKQKPILSQVLREAKEKAEKENRMLQETYSKKKMNYETLFDDYHGLVHLEALEMLSKQCEIKLQTLSDNCSSDEQQDLQETMDQIKELCELPDEDDDETPTYNEIKDKLQLAINDINVSITYDKLFSTWEDIEKWLTNIKLDICDANEIHQEAVQILAQLTAIAVEQFHKCGELLLIKEHRSTADEADSLVQLTMILTSLIGLVAAKFSEKLNAKCLQTGDKESINGLITNVFFEAGNSSSYIQDAFQLLVPVLQVGAV